MLGKVYRAVGVDETTKPNAPAQPKELGEKLGVEHALATRAGDSPNEGHVRLHALKDLLCVEVEDAGRRVVGAHVDARIALHACALVPLDGAAHHLEGPRRARPHTGPAANAEPLRLRVVAVRAVDIATLDKD